MEVHEGDEGGLREQSWQRRLLWIVPAAVLIGLLIYGSLTEAEPSGSAEDAAPEFSLELLDGGTISSEDLEGQPVVINFWASWCAPCREEAPVFEQIWRDYRDEGIRFVGVNVQDNELGAADFVKEFDITYPIALDPDDELAGQLDVLGLPQTFFIDHEGRFLGSPTGPKLDKTGDTVVFGALSEDLLRSKVEELIERASAQ